MDKIPPPEEKSEDAIPQDTASRKGGDIKQGTTLQEMTPEDRKRFAAIIILMSADTR